ncbi:hypothetical protein [uncultured Desulfovibrio sp.]|uniref:hypothetical protein n=1 Tax=uncultured Desulfovibrio sp. TaxID=167968 RepID=UPI00260C9BD2|nr:hypothetical protein [uncultured Desulfovibrio sp.]
MKKILTIATIAFLGTLLCASVSPAAEKVGTRYFTFIIPDGWKHQYRPAWRNKGILAVLAHHISEENAVSVAILPDSRPAGELAAQTLDTMKTAGFTTTEPRAEGTIYISEISLGPFRGACYTGSNGKVGSVITILGPSPDKAKKLLRENFKPCEPDAAGLFPSSF